MRSRRACVRSMSHVLVFAAMSQNIQYSSFANSSTAINFAAALSHECEVLQVRFTFS